LSGGTTAGERLALRFGLLAAGLVVPQLLLQRRRRFRLPWLLFARRRLVGGLVVG
jgi:hypothetical protein